MSASAAALEVLARGQADFEDDHRFSIQSVDLAAARRRGGSDLGFSASGGSAGNSTDDGQGSGTASGMGLSRSSVVTARRLRNSSGAGTSATGGSANSPRSRATACASASYDRSPVAGRVPRYSVGSGMSGGSARVTSPRQSHAASSGLHGRGSTGSGVSGAGGSSFGGGSRSGGGSPRELGASLHTTLSGGFRGSRTSGGSLDASCTLTVL